MVLPITRRWTAYSIFSSSLYDEKRAARLRELRDEAIETNLHPLTVELLNSIWQLSTEAISVSNFSNRMVILLEKQSSIDQVNPLYGYYSFISLACDITSIQDIGKIPLQHFQDINRPSRIISKITNIPDQIELLFEVAHLLSGKSVLKSHREQLNKIRDILRNLATSLIAEKETPEFVCLTYVTNRWLELAEGAIRISLSHLKCNLKTNKPIYMNRTNEIEITISGGVPGQSFTITTPVTQNYEVQIDPTVSTFQDPETIIRLQVKPLVAGHLNILIGIEGITFQVETMVLLENPFIVGIPVQSEEMFVGRQEIVDRIIRGIIATQPTHFLVTGRRRIGKTSLLYAIKRQLPDYAIPVLISTETFGRSPKEICTALANRIIEAIFEAKVPCQGKIKPKILEDDPIGSFNTWLNTIYKKLLPSHSYQLVLLIDEALDLIGWDDQVQRLLRNIFSSMNWIRGVLAGPPDIIDKMTEDVSSPLYNIFVTVKLTPINKDDTHKLIVAPLERCGIRDAENMVNTIYDYSGGIPFYIQAIGSEIIENHFSNKFIEGELLAKSLTGIRERLETSYPIILKKLPAEQKLSLISIVNGLTPPEVCAIKLEKADLVEREGDKWTVRALVEREWVDDYMDQLLDSASQELWDEHGSKIDLAQLAKDLTKISDNSSSREISESLSAAISSAKKGNGARTLKYLANGGQWILDTATKIGAEVAATAIKHMYGLS